VDPATFERERLALFARHGFDGDARRIADRQGRTTYVIARGEGGPCPTVLVHGGLSEASEWCLLAGLLPGRVLVPDRPGCGLSYRVDYRGTDYRGAAAEWLLDLVDGIGAGQVDLVANSMGGYFSIAFALAHHDRVRRLALVGAPPGLGGELPLFLRLWATPVVGSLIGRMKITDPETLRKRVFPMLVTHPEKVPLDFLQIAVAADALPGADRTSSSMLRRVGTLRGWRAELLLTDDMARLPVPTLFAWGDGDKFVPRARGEAVAARMPDARFEVIPDAGHVPYLERPEAVAAAVNGFLAPGP